MIDQLHSWYANIGQHKYKEVYSPHKPLTIIFALVGILKGKRWIEYNRDRDALENLIAEFTNNKTKPNCLHPLWRLQNDSKTCRTWQVIPDDFPINISGDISAIDAKSNDLKAGFSEPIYLWLKANPHMTQYFISEIIEDNFPESLEETILTSLGINELVPEIVEIEKVTSSITKVKRDPTFAKRILQLYDYRCAFCGLKIYLNHSPVSLEAAHIKWKARGGDCHETNGLSLCPTHHFTFDRGLWTINPDYTIHLSENALFDKKTDIFFTAFAGRSIVDHILDKEELPMQNNILWHHRNILK